MENHVNKERRPKSELPDLYIVQEPSHRVRLVDEPQHLGVEIRHNLRLTGHPHVVFFDNFILLPPDGLYIAQQGRLLILLMLALLDEVFHLLGLEVFSIFSV